MRINVIAATGRLGGKVVEALLEMGLAPENIIASVRTPSKADGLAAQGIEVRRADYDDYESLETAFAGTDVLLLIPSTAAVEPRVAQFGNAVRAAKAAGVGRIVFAGVYTATPESLFQVAPFILYAESKIRQSGLEWTLVRANMYMESMLGWLGRFVEEGRLPYPLREGRIAFVAYGDLGRSIAAVLKGNGMHGKIFELSGPEAPSMAELAQVLSEETKELIRFDFPSEQDYLAFSKMDKASPALLDILLSMYRSAEAGEWSRVTDHVEQLTGRKPTSIREMAREMWKGR